MSTKYFALLTQAGTEKLERVALSGSKLEITHMAVGDGGGSFPIPNANQSGLINEKHRAELDSLIINAQTPSQIIAEQILPEGEGNWWIREMGLFDKDGTLIAVGNCAELYKPESQEQAIRMALTFSNSGMTGWIKELLSGLASRNYVREKIKEHAASRNHPNATLEKKGLVALSSEVNNDSEIHAATSKAVKTTYELANQANESVNSILLTNKYVPSTRKVNGKELSKDIELTATDVGTYDRIQTDSLVDKARQLANKALDQVKTKVPLSRQINGKELLSDIELTALDVNAYSKQDVDGLIGNIEKLANTANESANDALKYLDKKIPSSRKINNKELITDIQLTANDVGTYDKKEIDDRINLVQQTADTANNNANTAIQDAKGKVPESRRINDKELVSDIELRAVDVGAYGKEETDAIIKDIKIQIDNVNNLAENAHNNANTAIQDANSRVPSSRKINGKELATDIELTAADVGTYNKAELDDNISKVEKQADAAEQTANSAIQLVDSKVPSSRKVNGKELSTDIELTAASVDAYNKAEINILIDEVKEIANNANNTADHKVPLTRTVNGKALLSDINLIASDVNAYSKGEADRNLEDIKDLANKANNNADSRVPLTRTVNGKALLSDIRLTASDIGAYSKVEVDTRISKVESLANDANTNAIAAKTDVESRLAKSKNGADIPDKQAFVRNLGLGNLVGLSIESHRVTDEHTIIKLGEIFMINGLAVGSEPIAESHSSEIGGVTYYTHFYKIKLPTTLPNGIISGQASIVGDNFDNQRPSYLADVRTQRDNPNGDGLSKDTLTISVTTPHSGWVPNFYYQVIGY
ncbi:phage tail protein [Xenorhabdus kozodoii]|uniref:Tail protein n=1 Tax=Xenorhabdus kozodoii TaxID=351676 RepID=A0A2D0LG90_9GAMM|nr:phage tail protein [Xenorhabdus kozodoii]PHM74662.1 tail protein [Xenorhabdus kozodoii]